MQTNHNIIYVKRKEHRTELKNYAITYTENTGSVFCCYSYCSLWFDEIENCCFVNLICKCVSSAVHHNWLTKQIMIVNFCQDLQNHLRTLTLEQQQSNTNKLYVRENDIDTIVCLCTCCVCAKWKWNSPYSIYSKYLCERERI